MPTPELVHLKWDIWPKKLPSPSRHQVCRGPIHEQLLVGDELTPSAYHMHTSSVYNTFTRFLTPHYLSYAAPVPDETLRLIEIVSDDIKRVSDLHIPLNYAADTPSIESLLKTVKLSQTYVF